MAASAGTTKAKSKTARVLLVCCGHPKEDVEFDLVRDEAASVLMEMRQCLLEDYRLDPESVVLMNEASPEEVVSEIEKPGHLFLVALGHGGCNKLGNELEPHWLRGHRIAVPKRDPTDAEAVWLQLPRGKLTEEMLRTACLGRPRKSRLLMFLGACFSGGFFDKWLPEFLVEDPEFTSTFNFPKIAAITTANKRCQAGSWSWYELLRTLRSPAGSKQTILNFVDRLRNLDPSTTFYREDARGEAIDAAALCLFGSTSEATDATFRKFLGQPIESSDATKRRDHLMKCPILPTLAADQRIIPLSALLLLSASSNHHDDEKDKDKDKDKDKREDKNEDKHKCEDEDKSEDDDDNSSINTSQHAAKAFVESLRTHGFAILDVGDEAFDSNIKTVQDAAKVLLGPNTDEAVKQSLFDRTLDKQDENTNCGWAVAPETWEMYKFVYSGECQDKDDYPWPAEPANFRPAVVQYYLYMQRLAKKLSLLVAAVIGPDRGGDVAAWEDLMDPDPVPRDYYSNNDCRLFRYYGSSEMSTDLYQGEAHADLGLLAVGPLSDVDGIHFFDRRDMVWRAPERDPALQNRPLVAVWPGDLMRCLTGGYIAGGLHRVKLSAGSKDRYSMPFFIRARRGRPLRCLATSEETASKGEEEAPESYADYAEYEDKRFRYTQAAGCNFWYIPPF